MELPTWHTVGQKSLNKETNMDYSELKKVIKVFIKEKKRFSISARDRENVYIAPSNKVTLMDDGIMVTGKVDVSKDCDATATRVYLRYEHIIKISMYK